LVKLNRKIIQILAAVLQNGYFKGFLEGRIFTGQSKKICVPGLNCYSCPGALGSCPIGSLQAVIGSFKYHVSLYIAGFLTLFGVTLGRAVCGWLCPFGLVQEFLYKIPTKKFKVKGHFAKLKYLKYVILVVFVILLPMLLTNEFGIAPPYFCQYICPVGTLEGGIPLVLMNDSLKQAIGWLFTWKMGLLTLTIIGTTLVYRGFCRFICPLGAIYAFFNKISFYRFEMDKSACTSCKACNRSCKMDIDVMNSPNDHECIRCNDCIKACPTKAIKSKFSL